MRETMRRTTFITLLNLYVVIKNRKYAVRFSIFVGVIVVVLL